MVWYWRRNSSTTGQDDSKPLFSLQHLSTDNGQQTHELGGGRGSDVPHPPTSPAPQADAGHTPAVENALVGIEQVAIDPAITQMIAGAFYQHTVGHVKTIHSWGNRDINVYRALDGANRGVNNLLQLPEQCVNLSYPLSSQLQKMLAQNNYPPENKLFDYVFTPADLSNKAGYILNMMTDAHLIGYLKNALTIFLEKDWEKFAGNQAEFYYRLASFFEYARIRALSGHVPPKLITKQLKWAAIDLEVWVDNVVKYVTTQPDGQDSNFIKDHILRVCSPTSEQILLKYNSYKDTWHLPNFTLADIQPYGESLAHNYSTAMHRYEQDLSHERDHLISSSKLQNMEKITTHSASGATSDSSTQEGASTSGSARAGASTSSLDQPVVLSPLEPTSPIYHELSAGIAHLEFVLAEFAGPGIVLMLIVLALGLAKRKGQ